MSIYDDPKEYAEKTFMTLEQADIRCKHFKKLKEEIHQASKCPKCGQFTLEIEGGSYEENIQDYVYCSNDKIPYVEDGEEYTTDCDFTSDVEDKFIPISHWYDFDEVLMFSIDVERDGMEQTQKMIGSTWSEFVDRANERLKEEEGRC